jgi:hypothetical protein
VPPSGSCPSAQSSEATRPWPSWVASLSSRSGPRQSLGSRSSLLSLPAIGLHHPLLALSPRSADPRLQPHPRRVDDALEQERLYGRNRCLHPRLHLILDVWTTRSSKSAFMGGTVAYIDKVSCSLFVCPWLHLNMRLVRTQAWILRVDFACFKLLTGRHDGKTLAVPVASLLERRGWDAKFAVRRFALGAPLILSYLF